MTTSASIKPGAQVRSTALRGADGRVSTGVFWALAFLVGLILLVGTRLFFTNEYFFFAAYVVLQYVVLSTAWNILGGYTGYTNFGTAAFLAVGAYSSVVLHKLPAQLSQSWFGIQIPQIPLPIMMLVGGIVAGLIGLGMGYLTLRLRGVFFAIATLALAIVVQTLIVNWDFVGGSRGIYIIRPQQAPIGGGYIQYLYTLMLIMSVIAVSIARTIERSRLGLGFAAIRDDELAAEAGGVPTLKLKLVATTLSGALMGMAGAPLPYYVTYLDPTSSFNLAYAVNSVAMPVIGGMTSWIGPIIGAVLLGTIQQLATVTISSALNLLIVGLLLIGFVIIAPNGIVGLGASPTTCTGRVMADSILHVQGLGKRFGGFVALDNVSVEVMPGERLGLIGPNGSGKSTFVNCLCGTLRNEIGTVTFDGKPLDGLIAHERTRLGLARSFQLPKPFHTLNLVDNLRVPLLYTVNARHGGTRLSEAEIEQRCLDLLGQVGLAAKARRMPRDLTQVEMRKLELARAVATQPRLLFADEAMAGLSHAEVEEILAVLFGLNEQGITIVLIEHIMRAVMSFSTRLMVLVAGQKIADGNPQEVMRNPEVERAYLGE